MSYEMKILRKEDLSLYYYIKDTVLRDFVEREEQVPLNLMTDLCDYNSYVYEYVSDLEPSPTERGRGWRYFNPPSGTLPISNCQPYPSVSGTNSEGESVLGTPEQSFMVVQDDQGNDKNTGIVVYENGSVVVSESEYIVDYIDGRIITSRALIAPAYVDFDWNYVSVVDEWAAVEAADPPVVVIDLSGTDKMGYQLGGGKKAVRKVDIHIFATDPAERNDIVETLYDGLYNRSCPLYELATGGVLDYDGTFFGAKDRNWDDDLSARENKLTYLFDRGTVDHISSLYFDAVVARHINLPLIMTRGRDEVMLSDLNAYRSKVSFDMFSYDDRNTGRTY
jgi:hypothetical protein